MPKRTDEYKAMITEIKVESDMSRYTAPFIELYNPSIDITLRDLEFSGVVSGNATNDDGATILPQGYYLILYDGNYSAGGSGGSGVSCHECDCTQQSNGLYCNNSIYIQCNGDDDPCSFQDLDQNTNWYLTVEDRSSSPAVELDTVTWDNFFPNLTNLVGYSYELKHKGYNNDEGNNWQISCDIYGSPGADPIKNCTTNCTTALCQANGAVNVFADSNGCGCDSEDEYYEDGCSCQFGVFFALSKNRKTNII